MEASRAKCALAQSPRKREPPGSRQVAAPGCSVSNFSFNEFLSRFVNGQHVGHELAGHQDGGFVFVGAAVDGFLAHAGERRVPLRGELGGFDEDGLKMLVALFGQGAAPRFARGFVLPGAQAAVADGFLDVGEAVRIVHFKRPGQRGDLPDA